MGYPGRFFHNSPLANREGMNEIAKPKVHKQQQQTKEHYTLFGIDSSIFGHNNSFSDMKCFCRSQFLLDRLVYLSDYFGNVLYFAGEVVHDGVGDKGDAVAGRLRVGKGYNPSHAVVEQGSRVVQVPGGEKFERPRAQNQSGCSHG